MFETEIASLKEEKGWSKSALISWGGQSRQIFFKDTQAIETLTKKIKEFWGIPRKFYWLSVNGKHESTISSWPQNSTVEIHIRGPAGAVTAQRGFSEENDWENDDVVDPMDQEDHYERPKEKFPKGWVKIGIMGGIIRVRNNQTLEQACEPFGIQLEPEFWLPNGRRAAIDEKMRYYFPPGQKEPIYIDEVIDGDPRRLRTKLGVVRLEIGEEIILIQNNTSFKKAFEMGDIEIQAPFVLLPNGKRVEIGQGKIRQFIRANPEKEVTVRWDLKTKPRAEAVTLDDPMLEGVEDLAKETKDFDPYDDCRSENTPRPSQGIPLREKGCRSIAATEEEKAQDPEMNQKTEETHEEEPAAPKAPGWERTEEKEIEAQNPEETVEEELERIERGGKDVNSDRHVY
jgi:hypothetical protein